MANLVTKGKTTLDSKEVIVRSVQFFSTEKWRTKSQSDRIATFEGMPKIPWFLLFLTFLAFLAFIIPGLILWFLVIRKARKFQNLVVTANPIAEGTEVVVQHPKDAKRLVRRFVDALPPLPVSELVPEPA